MYEQFWHRCPLISPALPFGSVWSQPQILQRKGTAPGPSQPHFPHCAFDMSVFGLCQSVAHPLLFQWFQNVDVSFPSLSQFSLFIGRHFWLLSRLWLLADGLLGSAGKFEQFSVFTSVPSLGTGCWQDTDFFLFGQVPILKQYNLHHLPWGDDEHFSQTHDDRSVLGISFCWSVSFPSMWGFFLSLKCFGVSLSLLSWSWTSSVSSIIYQFLLCSFHCLYLIPYQFSCT